MESFEVAGGRPFAPSRADPKLVLRLPEILHNIFTRLAHDRSRCWPRPFRCFEEDRTLCSVVRVNSVWFDCGTHVLWAQVPLRALTHISPSRRQIYASKIAEAAYDGPIDGDYRDQDLSFPVLRRLSVHTIPADKFEYLDPYLQPALRAFFVYRAEIDSAVYSRLSVNCPRIKEIHIENPGRMVTSQLLLDFLKATPTVERVELTQKVKFILNKDLLFHLASRPNLKRLNFSKVIDLNLLDGICGEIELPFQSLEDLSVGVKTHAAHQLLCLLGNLQKLDIRLYDHQVNVFPSLARLSNLRELEVNFWTDTYIGASDIVALKALSHLEVLCLGACTHSMDYLHVQNFDHHSLKSLVSGLPCLRVLRLHFPFQAIAELEIVAQNCRSLEHLDFEMVDNMEFSSFFSWTGTMFPKLHTLEIGSFPRPVNDGPALRRAIATSLRDRCPCLQFFGFDASRDNSFTRGIATEFEAQLKDSQQTAGTRRNRA